MILKNIKDVVWNFVCYIVIVIVNFFMYCGIISDQFFRDNLEWLVRVINWVKFIVIVSLGVIYKGYEKEVLQLMVIYFFKDIFLGLVYQEGGGFYVLGFIYVNYGGDIIDYLFNQFKNVSNDIVRYGGSLGFGLVVMGIVC